MNIEILDAASLELDEAFNYYSSIQPSLGDRFINEFEASIKRIANNPLAWQIFGNLTRRCLFNRFPYSVVFQVRSSSILIVAIASHQQEPFYWVNRS